MKTNHKIKSILLSTILLSTVMLVSEAKASENESVTTTSSNDIAVLIDEYPKYLENGKPKALDIYWDRMAQCETGGDWKNGGRWSGGLGIYQQTWIGFGGKEFAAKPHLATRQEQIIIANRISTQGYQTKNTFRTLEDKQNNKPHFQNPVGFGGWGCKKSVGNPVLVTKPPYKIYFWKFPIGERSQRVRKLQRLIGVEADGYYGEWTKKKHLAFVKKYRQSIEDDHNNYLRSQVLAR